MPSFFLEVSAKLETHGRKHFAREVIFAARSEALIQRRAEHRRRSRGFNGRENCPAAFAGIGDAPGETRQILALEQGPGGEIE